MSEKMLMKGAEAIAEGAIKAGCRYFFGYPITPQNETPEYFSRRMPEVGGVYLQAESEVASINMVYGAACAGKRAMTSSSSPGISLMQEGISYIVGSNVPAVIVNVMRGGPGLGNIAPAQGDYFQATKGGGHGDYKLIVLAPSTLQETIDIMFDAFDLAEKYRMVSMILVDGLMGQMMEPIEFKKEVDPSTLKIPEWATIGRGKREHKNVITSLDLIPENLEKWNYYLQDKYRLIEENEIRVDEFMMDDAEYTFVAYGTMGRIAKTSIKLLRQEGIKAGLIRPITLWPYPVKTIKKYVDSSKLFFVVEMSVGQMLEDVKLAVNGKKEVHFYGRPGGVVPGPQEIRDAFLKVYKGE